MMNKDILILGGARFHGLQLAEYLVNSGNKVFVLNRGRYKSQYDSKIKHIVADRNNYLNLKKIFDDYKFDAIVDNNAYKPFQVETILNVFRNRCEHYIFTSSIAVYLRVCSDYKVKEEESTGVQEQPYYPTIKDYALLKLESEGVVQNESKELNYTILRLPSVFGEGDFLGKLSSFYYRLIDGMKVLMEKEVGNFNLIYVKDLVKIIGDIIGNKKFFGKVVNIADPTLYNYENFFNIIFGDIYSSEKLALYPAKKIWEAGYPFSFHWGPMLDLSKINKLLGEFSYTPLNVWGKKTLKWELDFFENRNFDTKYNQLRKTELKIIKEFSNGKESNY